MLIDQFFYLVGYIIVAVVVAKILVYQQRIDRKDRGITNWSDVDPTMSIVLGLFWPLVLPIIIFLLISWAIVFCLKKIFFKNY